MNPIYEREVNEVIEVCKKVLKTTKDPQIQKILGNLHKKFINKKENIQSWRKLEDQDQEIIKEYREVNTKIHRLTEKLTSRFQSSPERNEQIFISRVMDLNQVAQNLLTDAKDLFSDLLEERITS